MALTATPARAVEQEAIERAIEKGVRALRAMQQADGTWPYHYIGATALAGLTLLECGAEKEDAAVLRAADAVRRASVDLTHTYSISLSLLFLDRLGDREDEPLMESLILRLMAGQDAASGGWSYGCPPLSQADKQRLQENLKNRKKAAVPSYRAPERGQPFQQPGAGGPVMPPLPVLPGGEMTMVGGSGDNSNTQFAALGLWVGRRHGAKITNATNRLADRFRAIQLEAAAGPTLAGQQGCLAFAPMPMGLRSTPSMTSAD